MKRSLCVFALLSAVIIAANIRSPGTYATAQTDKKIVDQTLRDAVKMINDGFTTHNSQQMQKGLGQLKVFTAIAPDSNKMKASAVEALEFLPRMRAAEAEEEQKEIAWRAEAKRATSKTSSGPGVVTNGHALSKPKPKIPPVAQAAGASGEVTVKFLIDEQGRIIKVTSVTGHPLLQAPAAAAALASRFSPTLFDGRPVKVTGSIVYNFSSE